MKEIITVKEKIGMLDIQETPPLYQANSSGVQVQKNLAKQKYEIDTRNATIVNKWKRSYTFDHLHECVMFMVANGMLKTNESLSYERSNKL